MPGYHPFHAPMTAKRLLGLLSISCLRKAAPILILTLGSRQSTLTHFSWNRVSIRLFGQWTGKWELCNGQRPAHPRQLHQPVRPGVRHCIGTAPTLLQGESREKEGGYIVRRPCRLEILDIFLALVEGRRRLIGSFVQTWGVNYNVTKRDGRGCPP